MDMGNFAPQQQQQFTFPQPQQQQQQVSFPPPQQQQYSMPPPQQQQQYTMPPQQQQQQYTMPPQQQQQQFNFAPPQQEQTKGAPQQQQQQGTWNPNLAQWNNNLGGLASGNGFGGVSGLGQAVGGLPAGNYNYYRSGGGGTNYENDNGVARTNSWTNNGPYLR